MSDAPLPTTTRDMPRHLRHLVLILIPLAAIAALLSFGRMPQPPSYHLFADGRSWLGLPNFGNVSSNLAFLVMGGIGLVHALTRRPPGALVSWSVFFAGVALVSAGSTYYHWAPGNGTLVWDRLPMTIGFMGVYVALLAEYVDRQLERYLLAPAILLGFAGVIYWEFAHDLRLYFAVQAMSLGSALAILLMFRNGFRGKGYLFAALGSYALAIVCEQLDREIFALTGGAVSGHTIKHLFAALAPWWVFLMLRARALKTAYDPATGQPAGTRAFSAASSGGSEGSQSVAT